MLARYSGLITSSHKTALGRSMVDQTFTDLGDLAALGFDPNFIKMGCVEVDLNTSTCSNSTNNSNSNSNSNTTTSDGAAAATPMKGSLSNILHFDQWESTFAAGDSVPSAFDDFLVSEQFARDGVVSPTDLADRYCKSAKAINPSLEVRFNSEVVAAVGDSSSVDLTMADGTIVTAGNVVNAAGAWVDSLGSEALDADGKGVPIGLMRADYWLLGAPRQVNRETHTHARARTRTHVQRRCAALRSESVREHTI